jgi:hypothetical protein
LLGDRDGLQSALSGVSAKYSEWRLCSVSGRWWPHPGLTVLAAFRSFRRRRDRGASGRYQGTADIGRRRRAAKSSLERLRHRCRGQRRSRAKRMSAARGAGLTQPTPNRHSMSGVGRKDRASQHAMQSTSETTRSEAGCRPAGSRSRVRACLNLWISSDPAGDVREAEWQHDGSLDKLEDQGGLVGRVHELPAYHPPSINAWSESK